MAAACGRRVNTNRGVRPALIATGCLRGVGRWSYPNTDVYAMYRRQRTPPKITAFCFLTEVSPAFAPAEPRCYCKDT